MPGAAGDERTDREAQHESGDVAEVGEAVVDDRADPERADRNGEVEHEHSARKAKCEHRRDGEEAVAGAHVDRVRDSLLDHVVVDREPEAEGRDQGRADVAESEDEHRAQGSYPALDLRHHEREEENPGEQLEPAREPERARHQHLHRVVGELVQVRAPLEQERARDRGAGRLLDPGRDHQNGEKDVGEGSGAKVSGDLPFDRPEPLPPGIETRPALRALDLDEHGGEQYQGEEEQTITGSKLTERSLESTLPSGRDAAGGVLPFDIRASDEL